MMTSVTKEKHLEKWVIFFVLYKPVLVMVIHYVPVKTFTEKKKKAKDKSYVE